MTTTKNIGSIKKEDIEIMTVAETLSFICFQTNEIHFLCKCVIKCAKRLNVDVKKFCYLDYE
jgi:hypothetical protein